MRICHVIPTTHVGGAEAMLFKLLAHLDPGEFDSRVVSLLEAGEMGERIRGLGVPVYDLNLRAKRLARAWCALTLARFLWSQRVQLLQTWLYHADLAGSLAAPLAGRVPVVWNVRHSTLDARTESISTLRSARFCGLCSRWIPRRIVFNSQAAVSAHRRFGYNTDRAEVIPNGFDMTLFRPSQRARSDLRAELALAEETPLIGLLGRFHPHKDHRTFLSAAARLASRCHQVHFVLAGNGICWENRTLAGWIDAEGLRHRIHLLGHRADVPRIQAALDVAVCSSVTEGFPNVVGEAMACGVPCVATDVGDCRPLVASTGKIVPVGDPEALSRAVGSILELSPEGRAKLGRLARRRVQDRYDMRHIAARYAQLWRACRDDAVIRSSPETRRLARGLGKAA
jgi:glycosyltransferase involved in cell wall biosynthesis